MKLTTKFKIGQIVYYIVKTREKYIIDCSFCDGVGNIFGKDDQKRYCPECVGRGFDYKWRELAWSVLDKTLTLGQVRITAGYEPEERYMANETGLGSGSIYDTDKLFATLEEALDECDVRNEKEK